MLPSALLCRAAHEHVEVCIGGDGGDELFAGYNRHALGVTIDSWGHRMPVWMRRRVAAMALRFPPRAIDFVGRVTPGLRFPNLADKVQKAAHLLAEDTPVWDQLAGIWSNSAVGAQAHRPQLPVGAESLGELEEMMFTDAAVVLPDQMLVKVDRASMASSLEVRSPLLDSAIVEWSWSLPLDFKTQRGVGKLVMRRLANDALPKGIADRHKLGFDPPLARWLRAELRPWAEDLLAKPRCVELGWLAGDALRTTWAEHLAGRRNWEYRLWAVLMLEAWLAEHNPG
jgi:asparagine synthase (glutamine-hydrolysing)